MRRIVKILTSKVLILGLFLLIQLLFLGFIIDRLVNDELIGIYINMFFNILSILIVIHVVSSDMNPEYKIAWIIPILALPVFGTFFYLLYHQNNITKKTLKNYFNITKTRNKLLKNIPNKLKYKEILYLNNN